MVSAWRVTPEVFLVIWSGFKMVDEFLTRYIDSYETFVDSMQGVSTLMFAAVIYLMSRKIGIVQDGRILNFSHPWLLIFCGFSCVVTFASNFLIHGAIADFFSVMYQGEIDDNCEYETSIESHMEYFHECIRRERLRYLAIISLISCLLSILSMSAWLCVQGRRRHDRIE